MKYFLGLLFISLLFIGCTAVAPMVPYHNEEYRADPKSFTILGSTMGTAKSVHILGAIGDGILFTGDGGFNAAYRNAMKHAEKLGGNDLINVYCDYRIRNILYLYIERETIVYGMVVRNSGHSSALDINGSAELHTLDSIRTHR